MGNIKIYDYETDTLEFTFSYNPQIFDDDMDFNSEEVLMPFERYHIIITKGGINPKMIVLDGHFSGTNKREEFNNLAKVLSDGRIKKLYFSDDRFYLVIGKNLKQNNTGDRINFIQYTATLMTPISYIMSDTLKTGVYTSSWVQSAVNSGVTYSFIEKIKVILSGSGSASTLVIKDNSNNGVSITVPAHSNNTELIIDMIKLDEMSGGTKVTKYFIPSINNNQLTSIRATNTNQKYLIIKPDENINTFEISGSTGFHSIDFQFRDGYLG